MNWKLTVTWKWVYLKKFGFVEYIVNHWKIYTAICWNSSTRVRPHWKTLNPLDIRKHYDSFVVMSGQRPTRQESFSQNMTIAGNIGYLFSSPLTLLYKFELKCKCVSCKERSFTQIISTIFITNCKVFLCDCRFW